MRSPNALELPLAGRWVAFSQTCCPARQLTFLHHRYSYLFWTWCAFFNCLLAACSLSFAWNGRALLPAMVDNPNLWHRCLGRISLYEKSKGAGAPCAIVRFSNPATFVTKQWPIFSHESNCSVSCSRGVARRLLHECDTAARAA